MHPKGYKTDYPMCPFGLRITDMQNSGMTLINVWGCDGVSTGPKKIVYVKLTDGKNEKTFADTKEMGMALGGDPHVILQCLREKGKWHEWEVVEIRRGNDNT